jgi:two-component sensor histidine kinase
MNSAEILPIRPTARIEFTMVSEANHRIANHLTLLASMVQVQVTSVAKGPLQLTRDEVHGMLREVAGKVISVGHLHRRLADRPRTDEIDLGDYLIESCHALISSLSLQAHIGLVHRLAASCPVKPEQAQPVALIVGEIIMNAVKHAHPTGIPVEISLHCGRNAKGRLVVEVEDDGIGFPENFDPKTDGGVGFKLMRVLADSLGADLDIGSDNLGTRFRLSLPADHQGDRPISPIS